MSVKCPKCGSGNVIGYHGEWECMDCGYKFKLPSTAIQHSGSRGKWVGLIVLALTVGLLLGYSSGYLLIPPLSQTVTITQPITQTQIIEKASPTAIEVTTIVITTVSTNTVTITSTVERTTTKEVVREETIIITPTRSITEMVVKVGEPASLGDYEFSISYIESPEYIKLGESYYKPHEDMKILVARVSALNIGEEAIRCPIGGLTLLTNKGITYEEMLPWYLELIPYENVSEEVVEHAMEYEVFPYLRMVPPNDYCEGHILFEYPADEEPASIIFKPDPYTTIEVSIP